MVDAYMHACMHGMVSAMPPTHVTTTAPTFYHTHDTRKAYYGVNNRDSKELALFDLTKIQIMMRSYSKKFQKSKFTFKMFVYQFF